MFFSFFTDLRHHGIKVSLTEYLDWLKALAADIIQPGLEEFYVLSRSMLIKHEGQLDAFDVLFGQHFQGRLPSNEDFWQEVPEEWLRAELEKVIRPEDLEAIEAMGGLDALVERFRQLMEEQNERHEGGNRFIGTGGTSPFGSGGFNTEGFRIGGEGSHGNALKVWEQRQYANLNDQVELNTRNIKMVLRRLRVLTREGRADELDLNQTIRRTSENAGMLDIQMRPTRRNRVKVLLLFDVGGSMDGHIALCEQLFSAARHEFKQMEYFYFHNCLYDFVWKDNRRRHGERIPTWQLLNTYKRDYKIIFVGDAAMSPIELTHAGGSVEHYNKEAGFVWLNRMKEHFSHCVWINPTPEYQWRYYHSTELLRKFIDYRMYPMTLGGIEGAMKALKDLRLKHGGPEDAETYR